MQPVPQDREGDNLLADIAIGNADGGRLQHRGMRLQDLVDLLGRDVHSALDDQFLRAADDEEVTVLIPIGEIARMQPTVRIQRRRGSGRVLVVALHHARRRGSTPRRARRQAIPRLRDRQS